jgi:SAM-dependent methyltransferase
MSVNEHYENLLADHYSWLFGGLVPKTEENLKFFEAHGIRPSTNRIAVDLGCGSGFQSIPLATIGFKVIAIDLCHKLLAELSSHKDGLDIQTVQDDILYLSRHLSGRMGLCVCMGDTLTHLDSREKIQELFQQVSTHMEQGGKFVLTFRDLSFEFTELDRFIPIRIRSEPNKIFTCYLEYEALHVKVHDLVYEKVNRKWIFKKSFYRKCRVPFEWVKEALQTIGFHLHLACLEKGIVTIIAMKM